MASIVIVIPTLTKANSFQSRGKQKLNKIAKSYNLTKNKQANKTNL